MERTGIVKTGHKTQDQQSGFHFAVHAQGPLSRRQDQVLVFVNRNANGSQGILIGAIKGQQSVGIDLW